jgi:hypothetical protein
MALPDEFDPDDNFAQAFGADADVDEEAALEALVWQLLLLINPDDEDAALQQFRAFRDGLADQGEEADAQALLREAIDWKAGFYIAEDDPQALAECLDELAARFNLRIDWDEDEDALDEAEVPALIHTAFDRLREHHYTLWTWETGDEHHAGWITRQHDDETLRLVAGALGFHVRTGAG